MALLKIPASIKGGDTVEVATKKFTPNAMRSIRFILETPITEAERKDGYLERKIDDSGEFDSSGVQLYVVVASHYDEGNHEISRYYITVTDKSGERLYLQMRPQTVYQLERALRRVLSRYGKPI